MTWRRIGWASCVTGRRTRRRCPGRSRLVLADLDADARVQGSHGRRARQFPGWVEWSTPRFEVGSGAHVQIGVDGEALVVHPPVVFESRPGALRVRLPRHALCVLPAARAARVLSGSTLAELGRVAAGRTGSDRVG